MTEFNTNPENEFVMKPGDAQEVGLYNRIAAINRINYIVKKTLPEFDLRAKDKEYLLKLDMEMWNNFYNSQPTEKTIDEEFCQRASKVCIDIETYVPEEIKEVIKEEKIVENRTWIMNIINWLNKK